MNNDHYSNSNSFSYSLIKALIGRLDLHTFSFSGHIDGQLLPLVYAMIKARKQCKLLQCAVEFLKVQRGHGSTKAFGPEAEIAYSSSYT